METGIKCREEVTVTHERFIIDSDRFVKKAEARGCILPGMEVREG